MVTQVTKVLFLTALLPNQKRGGGEVASQNFIDGLRQNGCQVSVVGYTRKGEAYEPEPYEIAVEERYIETSKAKAYTALWFVLSIFTGLPFSAAKYYSRAYINLVKSLLTLNQFDIVFIERSQLAWLVRFLGGNYKVIFITHNIERDVYLSHYDTSDSPWKKWLYAREARLIEELELEVLDRATEVWTLTDHDASYFAKLSERGIVKTLGLSPAIHQQVNRTIEKKFDIGLIGSWTWKFNEDGLRWFFESVYPELPSHLTIHVAGKGAEWLHNKYSNVQYEGFVPDAQVFMAQARVVALPTLAGGGIQVKALDALASGSAIVATPTCMRGISFNSAMVKVADNPEDFAALLFSEVNNQNTKTAEDTAAMAFEWLKSRKEKFLYDIACSVRGANSYAMTSVDQKVVS